MMDMETVLIECHTKEGLTSSSGILINQKYILITSNAVSSLLKDETSTSSLTNPTSTSLNFTTSNTKFDIVKRDETNADLFSVTAAKLFATFTCPNIKKSLHLLEDWSIDTEHNRHGYQDLISTFLILTPRDDGGDPDQLKPTLESWLEATKCEALAKGDAVYMDSVPFGNRHYLNSYSKGIVSNVLGAASCLLLSDCPSAIGSEGSPLYKVHPRHIAGKIPIGIALSSMNWWKGEWTGLTLFADIRPLLLQIVGCDRYRAVEQRDRLPGRFQPHHNIIASLELSLVQVYCGIKSWGTAILMDAKEGLLVTNSHVFNEGNVVNLYWRGQWMEGKLIYKTPRDTVYDLALIKCHPAIINKLPLRSISVSGNHPRIGDTVYSAGYSLFPEEKRIGPTLSVGSVSQSLPWMLKTSCSVHAGSSGGAILDERGDLVGIIVSNTRLEASGTIYPRLNIAIPVRAVHDTIRKFLNSNADVKILEALSVSDATALKTWRHIEGKL